MMYFRWEMMIIKCMKQTSEIRFGVKIIQNAQIQIEIIILKKSLLIPAESLCKSKNVCFIHEAK